VPDCRALRANLRSNASRDICNIQSIMEQVITDVNGCIRLFFYSAINATSTAATFTITVTSNAPGLFVIDFNAVRYAINTAVHVEPSGGKLQAAINYYGPNGRVSYHVNITVDCGSGSGTLVDQDYNANISGRTSIFPVISCSDVSVCADPCQAKRRVQFNGRVKRNGSIRNGCLDGLQLAGVSDKTRIIYDPPPWTRFCKGITRVRATAISVSGLTAECEFNVRVA